MNKRILFLSLLLVALSGVVFKTLERNNSKVEKLRKQHAEFFKNHPYQKTAELSKKQRKAQGLPPNAYFEQKYLSEINPNTGRIHKENVYKIQEQLDKLRAGQKVPGDADNPWIERGPDNVGGRTRALMFDPNDATNETVFAGGVSGGLWKNTKISNLLNNWVRVGVPENLAVSSIVADPNNPKIFYVGTGESYVSRYASGNGLWKSTDGGNSWSKIFGGVTGKSFFDTNTKLKINTPASISGEYTTVLSSFFGGDITSPITNSLVLVNDGTGTTEDGCEALTNAAEINGKIAVIRRGSCNFTLKVKAAQDAGAVAAIIVNNVAGNPFNMSGTDATITIPAVMIGKEIGDSIITKLATETVSVELKKTKSSATNATVVPGIQHINDVIVRNNGGTSEVYVAAAESAYTGGVSLGGDSYGLYKSVDGTNFTKVNVPKTANGNEYEPNNLEIASDNSIYLSTLRSSTYGDGGGAIFKSTDGSNFILKHTVPNGDRTEIALSPTNAGVVYVLAETTVSATPVKMYKTTDDFANVSDLPLPDDADTGIPATDFTRGQSWYDLLIKVDPNNENIVYVGGIDLFKSTNGGTSWDQISKWSNNNNLAGLSIPLVHADQHGLAFASSSRMVFGNDGGVYYSNDSGVNIEARNRNYNTLQFYTVGVAPKGAFGGSEYFIAGAQDNGTQLIRNASQGINSSTRVFGGDGAASFFDTDGTDKYHIANYVYNQAIALRNYATNTDSMINEENTSKGDFINQEELDSNLNILYSNYSEGNNYVIRRYSNILASVVKEELINSLMNAEPSAFKVSPHTTTSTKLLVGLKNGKLLKVENANTGLGVWSEITGSGFVGSISDIEFGETEDEIFVTMHNYGVKNIWYSNDGGANWKSKEGNLPDIPVKSILQNPLNKKEVIVGTDLGVWKTVNFDDNSPNWVQSYNGMSSVPVLDLDLRDDNVVFAATYGRGVFSGEFKKGSDPNGDDDGDGIKNGVDNCPNTANADQKDTDGNGVGDVCQDTDGDGIMDDKDNCINTKNPDQKDTDGNGVGDACQDTDGDGIMDDKDNCINTKNPDQKDSNGDGIGDVCQDSDGDGIMDDKDNCISVKNADQKDSDGNGVGDACQDTDGDGVLDTVDNCPTNANPDQKDSDGNGVGDACQDTDGDGIMDDKDNCINTKNADQKDTNGNGTGDVCDTSYLNPDNISIESVSETCVDQNDGKIIVKVKETFVSYTVTLKGDGKNETKQLTTSSLTFDGLKPASYEVCVKIDGKNYTQCFEINIVKASTVSLKVAKNQQSRNYTINISSGTAPYNVYLNGNLVDSYNVSTFNVNVQGSGVLEVKTAKECEGVFKTSIDNIFLKQNPVNNSINLILPTDSASSLDVTVYDVTGKTVLKEKIEKQGNELSIPFENFRSGIYILKIGSDKTNTFKILK